MLDTGSCICNPTCLCHVGNVLGSYRNNILAYTHIGRRVSSLEIQIQVDQAHLKTFGSFYDPYISNLDFYHRCSNYQWLGCEVDFTTDSGTDVYITCYINNLHPSHKSLYEGIEVFISLSIKPWNVYLVRGQKGGMMLIINESVDLYHCRL
jgi:hypothetical protein